MPEKAGRFRGSDSASAGRVRFEASIVDVTVVTGQVTGQLDLLLEEFVEGDRIEVAPHVITAIAGDRYGTVVAKGRAYLHVRMDLSRTKIRMVSPENAAKL